MWKGPLGSYPGEWNRKESGVAKNFFLCDLCGADIPQGTPCVAISMALNRNPYYSWEHEYITK
jgi:hypothetical protein